MTNRNTQVKSAELCICVLGKSVTRAAVLLNTGKYLFYGKDPKRGYRVPKKTFDTKTKNEL